MKKFKEKTKILFAYRSLQSFVERDLEILQKYFDVKSVQWRGKRDLPKIALGVLKSDLTFSWFAGDYAAVAIFFSKLFSKKSIVIAGGGDVAYVPEINYGQFTLGWHKRTLTKFALKHADKVLVVDPSLKGDAIKNAKINGGNIDYLPTGYDPNYWKPKGEKEDIILTVGGVNESVMKRKGFEAFVKSAKYIPNVKFVLVGKHVDNSINYLRGIAPSNVEFTGFVTDEELLRWYQRAKVYCQLSRYEGLPNALCEAMLCECVPVGTKYCGIPTGIGNTGFYVPYADEKATAEAIKKALNDSEELGRKARERIMEMFPRERREKELIDIIKRLEE